MTYMRKDARDNWPTPYQVQSTTLPNLEMLTLDERQFENGWGRWTPIGDTIFSLGNSIGEGNAIQGFPDIGAAPFDTNGGKCLKLLPGTPGVTTVVGAEIIIPVTPGMVYWFQSAITALFDDYPNYGWSYSMDISTSPDQVTWYSLYSNTASNRWFGWYNGFSNSGMSGWGYRPVPAGRYWMRFQLRVDASNQGAGSLAAMRCYFDSMSLFRYSQNYAASTTVWPMEEEAIVYPDKLAEAPDINAPGAFDLVIGTSVRNLPAGTVDTYENYDVGRDVTNWWSSGRTSAVVSTAFAHSGSKSVRFYNNGYYNNTYQQVMMSGSGSASSTDVNVSFWMYRNETAVVPVAAQAYLFTYDGIPPQINMTCTIGSPTTYKSWCKWEATIPAQYAGPKLWYLRIYMGTGDSYKPVDTYLDDLSAYPYTVSSTFWGLADFFTTSVCSVPNGGPTDQSSSIPGTSLVNGGSSNGCILYNTGDYWIRMSPANTAKLRRRLFYMGFPIDINNNITVKWKVRLTLNNGQAYPNNVVESPWVETTTPMQYYQGNKIGRMHYCFMDPKWLRDAPSGNVAEPLDILYCDLNFKIIKPSYGDLTGVGGYTVSNVEGFAFLNFEWGQLGTEAPEPKWYIGTLANSQMSYGTGMGVGPDGTLYHGVDGTGSIYSVNKTTGDLTMVAGIGSNQDTNKQPTTALNGAGLNRPRGMSFKGNTMYSVSAWENIVRKITLPADQPPNGYMETVVGGGLNGNTSPQYGQEYDPLGIYNQTLNRVCWTIDQKYLYVADTPRGFIYRWDPVRNKIRIAATAYYEPWGMAPTTDGGIVLCEQNYNRIRKIHGVIPGYNVAGTFEGIMTGQAYSAGSHFDITPGTYYDHAYTGSYVGRIWADSPATHRVGWPVTLPSTGPYDLDIVAHSRNYQVGGLVSNVYLCDTSDGAPFWTMSRANTRTADDGLGSPVAWNALSTWICWQKETVRVTGKTTVYLIIEFTGDYQAWVDDVLLTIRDPNDYYMNDVVAGSTNGNYGNVDDYGTAARLDGPKGICRGPDGWFYLVENSGHRIKRVRESDWKVETLFSNGGGVVDGFQDTGKMLWPEDITYDPTTGNFYFSTYVDYSANTKVRYLRKG